MPVERWRPTIFAVLTFAQNVVNEEILGNRNVTLQAENLGYVRDTARNRHAGAESAQSHRPTSRSSRGWSLDGSEKTGCHDHRLDARHLPRAASSRAAWPIEPSWPVFIACSRSKSLGPAHFANDNAVGPHAQAVVQPSRAS